MNFSRFLCRLPLLAAMLAAGTLAAADRPSRPNIVLILADDFGYEAVTANGGESYETPQLDRLAAEGMRFERCHVQPVCTPTRVELMTGIYNVRNYIDFGTIDRKATTFAHLLQRAGYATGIAGKWQLQQNSPARSIPQRLGFAESLLWQQTRTVPRYANPGLERNGEPLDFTGGEYGPKLVNDFALDFVTRHKDGPFLLYYPMILPHDPFQPTPDSADWDPTVRSERSPRDPKYFADMTAYLDRMVGRLLARLDELGLRENTLVIFLGDNGTAPTVTSRFQGRPYRGGKGTGTAHGTHVPLLVRWPGQVPAGQVNGDLIGAVDLLPTLCEAAGLAVPAAPGIDGRSFLPQLLGRPGQPREWLYSWYARDGGPKPTHEYAMNADYKLYRDGRFFDLRRDELEERPVPIGRLDPPAAAAARKLQAVLDGFKDARPPVIWQPWAPVREP